LQSVVDGVACIREINSEQGHWGLAFTWRSGNDIKKGETLPGSGLCWELPIVLAEEEEVHPHGENPHHVKRWEGSGCVLDPRMLDGVWQHDVQYMCKYSTTSFIDHFNEKRASSFSLQKTCNRCSIGFVGQITNVVSSLLGGTHQT
jgi:hypothetical protein